MCAIFLCADRFGLGWAHDAISFACHMFMHFPCIRTSFQYIWYIWKCLGLSDCDSFSPSLLFMLVVSMAPRCKSTPAGTLFIPVLLRRLILLYLISGFVMMMPLRYFRRTFLNEAFIRNAKSSYRIFPILTYPLSSTVRVRSHYVASRSRAFSWSYRNSTPICTDLIILYPSLSLAFKVYTW